MKMIGLLVLIAVTISLGEILNDKLLAQKI